MQTLNQKLEAVKLHTLRVHRNLNLVSGVNVEDKDYTMEGPSPRLPYIEQNYHLLQAPAYWSSWLVARSSPAELARSSTWKYPIWGFIWENSRAAQGYGT